MTEGGSFSGSGAPRLRIKGRAASVLRFFSISVAFMVLWILVTSQLSHYSKLYGPQILLQLNLAFYLPSIPVLLLSGSLERLLDARLGPIRSIALRLNTGLTGCLVLSAIFPVLPGLHPGDGPLWPLLTAVAVLGGMSAVAFSTSYQFVQFFRAADTIGLGVGCVGAGPLVLLMQVAMQVGPNPKKWQWIAMYEVSAGLIAAGLLSSVSLMGQYWHLLNGAAGGGSGGDGDHDVSIQVPLLAAATTPSDEESAVGAVAAVHADDDYVGLGADGGGSRATGGVQWASSTLSGGVGGAASPWSPYGSGGLRVRARTLTPRRPTTAPDPFNIFNLLTPGPDGRLHWALDEPDDDTPPVLLRRSASAGMERTEAAAARRRKALTTVGLNRSNGGYSRTTAAVPVTSSLTTPVGRKHTNQSERTSPPEWPIISTMAVAASGGGNAIPAVAPESPPPYILEGITGMTSAPAVVVRGGVVNGGGGGGDAAAARVTWGSGGGSVLPPPVITALDVLEFGEPDDVPVVQATTTATAAEAGPPPGWTGSAEGVVYGGGSLTGFSAPAAAVAVANGSTSKSTFASTAAAVTLAAALSAADRNEAETGPGAVNGAMAVAGAQRVQDSGEGPSVAAAAAVWEGVAVGPTPPAVVTASVQQEVMEVIRADWQVLLGFTLSVTTLYIVFPFFTYVKPAGALGDSLPTLLFYARLFTDLAGRLLPRVRRLQLRSGTAVLALAGAAAVAAGLFFTYILAPERWVVGAPRVFRNDLVPVVLVVFLWLTGGYTNTISNMLAPAQVPPELAGRASALMALLFNVAHIGGLLLAAAGAAAVWGDVVG